MQKSFSGILITSLSAIAVVIVRRVVLLYLDASRPTVNVVILSMYKTLNLYPVVGIVRPV
jgi:hypothetical protein